MLIDIDEVARAGIVHRRLVADETGVTEHAEPEGGNVELLRRVELCMENQ